MPTHPHLPSTQLDHSRGTPEGNCCLSQLLSVLPTRITWISGTQPHPAQHPPLTHSGLRGEHYPITVSGGP